MDNANKESNPQDSLVDALESIIMAHAGCGVDIASNDYVAGIETAWEALANADFTVELLG